MPQTMLVDNPAAPHLRQRSINDSEGILGEALTRFDTIWQALQLERAQALGDRRFAFITGAQWEGDWGELFANSIKVEINKAAQGLNDIIDQYKANRIIVNFRSVGPSKKDDAASTLNGMFLADYYNSKGYQATDNAFIEAAAGGYGAFRLTNIYCDDQDEDDDKQKIVFQTIVDADQQVFWDPNAKLYDKSDAGYCYVMTDVSLETFESDYPGNATSWPMMFIKPYYDWYVPQSIKVAEYYKILEINDTCYRFVNKLTSQKQSVYKSQEDYKDIIADLKITGWEQTLKKDIKRKECRKWILSGQEVLNDEGEKGMLIAGGMIPVIPVYGQRVYIDNLERSKGHIRLAKDPQRVYNVQISKLTETAALAPIERPIVTAEQIEGHEQEWAEMNINRAAYATLNTIIDESTGQKLLSGPVGMISPPQLSPVLSALIQITNQDIKELTNSEDGASQVKANVSADAMSIAAERTDDKAALYISNMKDSMQRAGEIYQAMAKEIYFEDDREVPILTYDKNQKPVYDSAKINERVTTDSGAQLIKNQIGKTDYKVIADVAEETKTKRDKTVKSLYNALQIIMPTDPELGQIVAATMFMNMDGDGMEDLQTYVRNKLLQQGVIEPTDEEKVQLAKQAQVQAQQPPSAEEQLVLATAQNQSALAAKAVADKAQLESKVLVNQAQAAKLHSETGATQVETVRNLHTPIEVQAPKPEHKQASVKPPTPTKTKSWLSRFGINGF